jgi:adenylate cyclase, class 2
MLARASSGNIVPATLGYTQVAMDARRRTSHEIEVKLRIADVDEILRRLRKIGAKYESRVLEHNTLFDTADSAFRAAGRLIRVRTETVAQRNPKRPLDPPRTGAVSRAVLTGKAPSQTKSRTASRYKDKLERELVIRNPAHWQRTLHILGFHPGFRYEKFRSTFRIIHLDLAIDLDETPAGVFLELEGAPRAIDRAARALGFAPRDYYRGTYWDVYAADCRRRGRTPRNMLFRATKSR